MSSKELIVSLGLDLRNFMSEISGAEKEIQKAGPTIAKAFGGGFDKLKTEVGQIRSDVNLLSKSMESMAGKESVEELSASINKLATRFSSIRSEFGSFQEQMRQSFDATQIAKYTEEARKLLEALKPIKTEVDNLFNTYKITPSIDTKATDEEIKESQKIIERYKKILNFRDTTFKNLSQAQQKWTSGDYTSMSPLGDLGTLDEELKKIDDAVARLKQIDSEIINLKQNNGDVNAVNQKYAEMGNISLEVKARLAALKDLNNQFNQSFLDVTIPTAPDTTYDKLMTSYIDNYFDRYVARFQSRIEESNKKIAQIAEASPSVLLPVNEFKFNLQDGQIYIPIALRENASDIVDKVRNLVSEVNSRIDDFNSSIQVKIKVDNSEKIKHQMEQAGKQATESIAEQATGRVSTAEKEVVSAGIKDIQKMSSAAEQSLNTGAYAQAIGDLKEYVDVVKTIISAVASTKELKTVLNEMGNNSNRLEKIAGSLRDIVQSVSGDLTGPLQILRENIQALDVKGIGDSAKALGFLISKLKELNGIKNEKSSIQSVALDPLYSIEQALQKPEIAQQIAPSMQEAQQAFNDFLKSATETGIGTEELTKKLYAAFDAYNAMSKALQSNRVTGGSFTDFLKGNAEDLKIDIAKEKFEELQNIYNKYSSSQKMTGFDLIKAQIQELIDVIIKSEPQLGGFGKAFASFEKNFELANLEQVKGVIAAILESLKDMAIQMSSVSDLSGNFKNNINSIGISKSSSSKNNTQSVITEQASQSTASFASAAHLSAIKQNLLQSQITVEEGTTSEKEFEKALLRYVNAYEKRRVAEIALQKAKQDAESFAVKQEGFSSKSGGIIELVEDTSTPALEAAIDRRLAKEQELEKAIYAFFDAEKLFNSDLSKLSFEEQMQAQQIQDLLIDATTRVDTALNEWSDKLADQGATSILKTLIAQEKKAEQQRLQIERFRESYKQLVQSLPSDSDVNLNPAGLEQYNKIQDYISKLSNMFGASGTFAEGLGNWKGLRLGEQASSVSELAKLMGELTRTYEKFSAGLSSKYTGPTIFETLKTQAEETLKNYNAVNDKILKFEATTSSANLNVNQEYQDLLSERSKILTIWNDIEAKWQEYYITMLGSATGNPFSVKEGTAADLIDIQKIIDSFKDRSNEISANLQGMLKKAFDDAIKKTDVDLSKLQINGISLLGSGGSVVSADVFGALTTEGKTSLNEVLQILTQVVGEVGQYKQLLSTSGAWTLTYDQQQDKLIVLKDLMDALISKVGTFSKNFKTFSLPTETEVQSKKLIDNYKEFLSLNEKVSGAFARAGGDSSALAGNVDYQKNVAAMNRAYSQYVEALNALNALAQVGPLTAAQGSVADIIAAFDTIRQIANEKSKAIGDTVKANTDAFNKEQKEKYNKAVNDYNKVYEELGSKRITDVLNINQDSLTGTGKSSFGLIKDAFDKLNKDINTIDLSKLNADDAAVKVKDLNKQLENLHKLITAFNDNKNINIYPENAVKGYAGIVDEQQFRSSVEQLLNSKRQVLGDFQTDEKGLVSWVGQFKEADGAVKQVTYTFDSLNGFIIQNSQAIQSNSNLWGSFAGGVKKGAGNLKNLALTFATLGTVTTSAVWALRSSITQGKEALLSYDKALTNIKYTMNMTESEFEKLGESSIQLAKDLNTSIEDAMTIAQVYANMQTTSEEIMTVAKPTAILSNLAGISTEEASNEIQSVMQQFGLLEEDAMHIIDVYDMVSANIKMDYSQGIKNIAGAVKNAGQVASEAGLSFETLAATVAKISEITREDGSSIGVALRTMITRISKASKLSGADEVDNETLSQASKALHDVGVAVYNTDGSFRDLTVILSELSDKWDNLTDAQKSNLSYQIAATRQINKFQVMMKSFAEAQELAAQASETEGNALANQEKYMDSMAGQMQSIKTDIADLWLNLYNDVGVQQLLEKFDEFIEGLSERIKSHGAGFSLLGISIGTLLISGLSSVLKTGLSAVINNIGLSILTSNLAPTLAEKTAKALIPAVGGISVAIAGAAVAGIGIAIASQIKKEKQAIADAVQVSSEQSADIVNAKENLEDYEKTIRKVRASLADENTSEEEAYELKAQLADIQDQLKKKYQEFGGAAEGLAKKIDLVNGDIKEQIELIQTLSNEEIKSWGGRTVGVHEAGSNKGLAITNEELGQQAYDTMYGSRGSLYLGKWSGNGINEVTSAMLVKIGNAIGEAFVDNTNALTLDLSNKSLDEIVDLYDSLINGLSEEYSAATPEDKSIIKLLMGNLQTQRDKYQSELDTVDRNILKSYGMWQMANNTQDGLGLYSKAEEAAQKYVEALESGTQEELDKAKDNYADILEEFEEFNKITDNQFEWLFKQIWALVNQSEDLIQAREFKNKYSSQLIALGQKGASQGIRGEDIRLGTLGTDSVSLQLQAYAKMAERAGISTEEFADWLEELVPDLRAFRKEIEEISQPIDMKTAVERTGGITEKANKVSTIIDTMNSEKKGEGQGLSNEQMNEIYDLFSGETDLGEGIDEWIVRLDKARSSATETEKILNELMVTWANQTGVLKDADGATKDYIEHALEDAGFAYGMLTKEQEAFIEKQYEANQATIEAGELTEEEISKLKQEATQVGITEEEWYAYYMTKYSNTGTLDFSGDITTLAAIAKALFGASDAWVQYYQARANLLNGVTNSSYKDQVEAAGVELAAEARRNLGYDSEIDYETQTFKNQVSAQAQEEINAYVDAKVKETTGAYGAYVEAGLKALENNGLADIEKWADEALAGAVSKNPVTGWDRSRNRSQEDKTGNGSGGSGSESEASEKEYDWLERALNKAQKAREQYNQIISDQNEAYEDQLAAVERLKGADQELVDAQERANAIYQNNWEKGRQNILDYFSGKDNFGSEFAQQLVKNIEEGNLTFENWRTEFTAGKAGELDEAGEKIIENAISANDNLEDGILKLDEYQRQMMDDILQAYEIQNNIIQAQIDKLTSKADSLQSDISIKVTVGELVTKGDYQALIDNADRQIEQYRNQIANLEAESRELEVGSAQWYSVQSAIASAEQSINSLIESQAGWNEEIKNIPINLIKQYLTVLGQLQTKMTSFVDQQQALGKVISEDVYTNLIELSKTQIDKSTEEIQLLIDKLDGYNFGSDKYEETKSEIASVDQEITNAIQSMIQWNETILKMPLEKLDRYVEILNACQDTLNNYIQTLETRGMAVNEKQYQALFDLGNSQIKALTAQREYLVDMLNTAGYEAGSDKYNEIVSQINSIDSSLQSVIGDMSEWNEQILNIPIQQIERLNTALDRAENSITEYISQQESKGLLANENQYKLLLQSSNIKLESLNTEKELLKAQQANYEFGSTKYTELDEKIADVDSTISSVVSNTVEWSKALLMLPVETLSKVNEELQTIVEAYNKLTGEYDQVLSAIDDGINNQIDLINDEKDATEELYEAKIKEIQDVIDALEKENELRQKTLAVESAEFKLQRAEDQKSIATIQDGKRVYEADQEAIRDAIQDLNSAQFELQIYNLEQQVSALEEERDTALEEYDAQIERLGDQAELWSKIVKNINEAKDAAMALQYLGDGWLDKILSGNDSDIYNQFKSAYEKADAERTSYEDTIESNETIASYMEEYINRFLSGENDLSTTADAINNLIKLLETGIDGETGLSAALGLYGGGDALSILSKLQSSALSSAQSLNGNLEYVGNNGTVIDSYLKDWDTISADVTAQIQQFREALHSDEWASYIAQIQATFTANENTLDGYTQSWNDITQYVDSQINAINRFIDTDDWGNYVNSIKEVYAENSAVIQGYTTTWEGLRDSIYDQLDALNKAYEEARVVAKTLKEVTYDYGYSSGGSSSSAKGAGEIQFASEADRQYFLSLSEAERNQNVSENSTGGMWSSQSIGDFNENDEYIIVKKHHSGLLSGYVGDMSSDKKLEALKQMALSPLRSDEIPSLLTAGEVVMTPKQVDNMLGNFKKLGAYRLAGKGNQSTVVNLNMNNLTFHEIQNGQDFANYISKNLSSAIAQSLSK